MVVAGRKCIWIRNNYKTGTTYGQKIITIYNKHFLNAMSKIEKWITETKEVQPQKIIPDRIANDSPLDAGLPLWYISLYR